MWTSTVKLKTSWILFLEKIPKQANEIDRVTLMKNNRTVYFVKQTNTIVLCLF